MGNSTPTDAGWAEEVPPADFYEGADPGDEYFAPPSDTYTGDDSYVPPGDFAPPAPGNKKRTSAAARMGSDEIMQELRKVIAIQHGRNLSELADLISQIRAADTVVAQLNEQQREVLTGVLEVLADTCTHYAGNAVDLTYIPLAVVYNADVQAELRLISTLASSGTLTGDPALDWQALRERVQRDRAMHTASQYIAALKEAKPAEDLVKTFSKIEPPTTRRAATRERAARTAAEIAAEHAAVSGGGSDLRISSGWPTVDLTFTSRKDGKLTEQLGFIKPGEGFVVAGPTGTGKSSWTYGFIPSAVSDIVNQGFPAGKVLFAHTEEESIDKITAFGMGAGQPFHHLADNLIVAAVGTSRLQLVMAIYDNVAEAAVRSRETGMPIRNFLIQLLLLDYVQSLSETGEGDMTASTLITAEFLLRGVQMWNPDEMAKWSGLSYRQYTGQPWPDGMERHRVAGIYMAQLTKQDDSSMFFRKGDKKCQLSDFALEASDPAKGWKGPDGNFYEWEVREGDSRMMRQNAIRGHGAILQNATAIIVLHRSRSHNNPAVTLPDGSKHLEDTRGRLLLDKMRTGGNLKYIPMTFDLDADGFRARYFDTGAERRLAKGELTVADGFARSGDPMLPIRQKPSRLAQIVY